MLFRSHWVSARLRRPRALTFASHRCAITRIARTRAYGTGVSGASHDHRNENLVANPSGLSHRFRTFDNLATLLCDDERGIWKHPANHTIPNCNEKHRRLVFKV